MNQIDRYVYAVLRKLPSRRRPEIERKLRTRIDEMLGQRTGNQPAGPADSEAVLRELGHPDLLADQYRGAARYLIGPGLIDTYWLVLRISLLAVAAGILVSFAVQIAAGPVTAYGQLAISFVSSLYSALASAFGLVTLIFALIEWQAPHAADWQKAKAERWNPADLPEVPVSSLRIKKSESIATLIFTLIALLIINVDIQAVGLYISAQGTLQLTPLFSSLFQSFLPWIDLSLALIIILEIGKLIAGRWNWLLVLGTAAQKVFGLIVGLRVFASGQIFNKSFFDRLNELLGRGTSWPAGLADTISQVIVIVIIFGFVIDMLVLVWKSIRLFMRVK